MMFNEFCALKQANLIDMNTPIFNTKLPVVGSKTLIYGHRGAMGYRPQNTLESFSLAWEMGVDGVELDVQCSRDGVPVLFHDDTLEKLTNGIGRIRDHDWASLAQLDAGSHFSAEYKNERIPTLEAVLRSRPAGAFVNIELKTELAFDYFQNETIYQNRPDFDPDSDPEMNAEAIRIAQKTAECLQALEQNIPDLLEHLIITSFHPSAISAFHALMPAVAIGHLFSHTSVEDTTSMMSQTPCLALHLDKNDITQTLVAQAHHEGKLVNCWTVNKVEDAQRLIDWDVDGILTNFPDVMLALLNKSHNLQD